MKIGEIRDPTLFQTLVHRLFVAEYGVDLQVVDDSRGDRGNDGYDVSRSRMLAIYCPETYSTDKKDIEKGRSDLRKAVCLRDTFRYAIEQWTYVTPHHLSERVQRELRDEAARERIKATFISALHLEDMYRRHAHLRDEFPQLVYPEVDRRLDEILSILEASRSKSVAGASREVSHAGIAAIVDEFVESLVGIKVAAYPDSWGDNESASFVSAVQRVDRVLMRYRASLRDLELVREYLNKREEMVQAMHFPGEFDERVRRVGASTNAFLDTVDELIQYFGVLQLRARN